MSDNIVDFSGVLAIRNSTDQSLSNFLWFFDFEMASGYMTWEQVKKEPLYILVSKEAKRRAMIGNENCRKALDGNFI